MTELEIFHTHLYPGARGQGARAEGPAVLVFSDGVRVAGEVSGDRLRVDGYTTAAGTQIEGNRWRLAFDGDGFRITARK